MRNSYLFLLIAVFASAIMSAQVKIGENPQNIDPSSVLELESTDKVLVITRVTTIQMNAIVPIQGALCYNTDLQSVHYYDGADWVDIGTSGGATLTADPIVNMPQSTIVITPTASGDNLEVAPESITNAQIKDGSITGTDIADGSIGPGKLQDGSVTIDKLSDNIDVSVFRNDAGYITAGDITIVSNELGNAIAADINGAAFYDDSSLMNDILNNTQAINDIGIPNLNEVLQESNNALNLKIVGLADPTNPADATNKQYVDQEIADAIAAGGGSTELVDGTTLTGIGTPVDPFKIEPGATGQILTTSAAGVVWANDAPGGTTEVIDGTTLTGIGTPVDPFKIEPGATGQILTTSAAGVVWANAAPGGGTTEVIDGTTLTGLGTPVDPFKIEPGATGQILTTDATGVVWANAAPGGGSTEEADQTTITGVGTNADPFKIEPGTTGQFLTTDATGVVWSTVTPGGGTTEVIDGTTLTGIGTPVDPFKIEPGAAGQILTTDATGVIWANAAPGGGSTEEADQTTITGVGTNADPFKIEPGATGQILTTNATGVVWANAAPSAAALTDGNIFVGDATNAPQDVTLSGDATIDNSGALTIVDDAITLAKINQNAATDGQILKWDDATTSWITAADDAGLTTLTDGNIFVGDATNAPQDVPLSGDATIDNLGALTIADDAITLAKINQNAASDGQVLKWDDATTSWITAADDAGLTTLTDGNIFVGDATNAPQDVALSGDATIDNLGALTIADDAITTAKIENATVLAEDLNAMGATADGDILKWNTALNAGAGGWETGANAGHTGTANEIFFADDITGAPTSTNGLIWNPTAINSAFPALGIGLDGRAQSTKAKVHIDEQLNGAGDISYGLQLQNRGNVGNSVGMIFAVNPASANGKGALLYERTGAAGVGDFHFLQAPTAGTANPGLADKAFTITNDKDIRLYRGIDVDGTATGFGLNNQVLASGGPGNPVKWVNAGSGGAVTTDVTISGDGSATTPLGVADNAITAPKIADGAVSGGAGGAIADNSITASDLQNDSVDNGEIRIDAVRSSEIQDGSIATADIGDTQVTVAKIAPGANGQVLTTTGGAVAWGAAGASNGPVQKGKVLAASGAAGLYTITVTGQTTTDYIINTSVVGNPTGFPTIIQVLGQNVTDFTVQIFEFNTGTGSFDPVNADWYFTIYNP